MRHRVLWFLALAGVGCAGDAAAQPAPSAQPPAMPGWASFPALVLERTYRGPLRDTVVQRWRDPTDGTVCFLYIPISAPLIVPPPSDSPYVQYGPNTIGSISCVPRAAAAPAAAAPTRPAPAQRRGQ